MRLLKYILLISFVYLFSDTIGQSVNNALVYYKFENNAADSSGNDRHGTTYTVGYSTALKVVNNYSIQILGNSSRIVIPTTNLGNAFTISLWTYTTRTAFMTMVANTDFGSNKNGVQAQFNSYGTSDGIIYFRTGNGTSSDNATSPSGTFTTGSWGHTSFSVNRTAGKCVIYRNGIKACDDSTILTDFKVNDSIYIGVSYNDQGDYIGWADEVLIHGFAATAAQVDSIYDLNYQIGDTEIPENPVTTPNFNVDIAHDQNFIIPYNANTMHYVGQLRPNANWDTISYYQYDLVSQLPNEDKFHINGLEGIIDINTSYIFSPLEPLYKVKFKITDYPYWDTATATIRVIPEDSCIFIDPLGSLGASNDSWADFNNNFQDGMYYFQNRATTCSLTATVNINADNVTIGAYGYGAYPIVNLYNTYYTSSSVNLLLRNFYSIGNIGLTIRDIQITNRIYDAFKIDQFVNTSNTYTTIDNCILTGNRRAEINRGSNLRFINNVIHDVLSDGIVVSGVTNTEFAYNSIYNVNKGYNQWGERTNEMFWGDCIQVEPHLTHSNADSWIHHNYLHKNDTNKAPILYGDATGEGDVIVEWNRLIGNTDFSQRVTGFYLSQGTDVGANSQDTCIFRYNTLKNFERAFQINGSSYFEMSYNTFINMGMMGWLMNTMDSMLIYNNTFYDIGDPLTNSSIGPLNQMWYVLGSASGLKMKMRNNIIVASHNKPWKNSTGSFTSNYNIYYTTLPTWTTGVTLGANDLTSNPNFYSTETLRLNNGSPAINSGTVSLRNYSGADFTMDLAQQALGSGASGARDRGAYEYLIPTTPYNPTPELHLIFLNPQNRQVYPLDKQSRYVYPVKKQ